VRSLALGLAVLATAGGCYDTHGPADGGLDGRLPHDAGLCRSSAGALICGSLECAIEACEPLPVDVGVSPCQTPASGGLGFCLLDMFRQFASALEQPCLRDGVTQAVVLLGSPGVAVCGADGLCDDFRELGFSAEEAACYYSDGSPYVTGAVPAVECAGLPGACGYGCAPCGTGQACYGPSEQSGLGVCVPTERDGSGDHVTIGIPYECGMVDGRLLDCSFRDGCLTFVVTDRLPGWDRGRCVELATCEALAVAHPERYRCNPDG
jgi:hypothetical protein